MTYKTSSLLFSILLFVSACSVEVDPEYLKIYEEYGTGICKCSQTLNSAGRVGKEGDPKAVLVAEMASRIKTADDCMAPYKESMESLKAPTGEPTGIYEASLTDSAQSHLRGIHKTADTCYQSVIDYRANFLDFRGPLDE